MATSEAAAKSTTVKDSKDSKTKGSGPGSKLVQFVNANDISSAERLLATGAASVCDVDDTGMTALMHAAYKGLTDMCRMLIKQGSDINADSHSHAYSALHFAALSSNLDTTQLLLDHGAKTYKINSVGRTAAQMAGFVGHAGCVALINNHLDRSELRRYTEPASPHQTTRLDKEAEGPLYNYIMQVNLHPVHLTLVVGRSEALMRHLHPAAAVLDHLSVAETKRTSNVNEVLSLKFHYLGFLMKHLAKEHDKYVKENPTDAAEAKKDTSEPSCAASFEGFLKQLLKCRSSDGAEVWQEHWLRDAVKAFHCVEMPLFMQVVRSMTGPDIMALSVLSGAINGQRGGLDTEGSETACVACASASKGNKSCAKCKTVHYCDRYCQRLHWSSHKKLCDRLSKSRPSGDSSSKDNKENNKNSSNNNKEEAGPTAVPGGKVDQTATAVEGIMGGAH